VTVVHAPLGGRVVSLADVPDPVFAGQVVGAGLAIEPDDGATEVLVVSPVAGRVAKVHPHALAIADESGTGVLVHLGIDTVRLHGAGFTLHVGDGDELALGASVITFDPTAVRAAGYSAVCPVVVLGSPKDSAEPAVAAGSTVEPGAELFRWAPAPSS
jgi:PTS system glucose-specific IIA component/PTS system N-acetylglucosamine-specific IIA component